jgi:threonine/homoserine/homoserine lactone efflux protein
VSILIQWLLIVGVLILLGSAGLLVPFLYLVGIIVLIWGFWAGWRHNHEGSVRGRSPAPRSPEEPSGYRYDHDIDDDGGDGG